MMRSLYILWLFLIVFGTNCFAACDDSDRPAVDGDKDSSSEGSHGGDSGGTDKEDCKASSTVVGTHGQLQVDGRELKNSCGDAVRLKGISSMWLNWEYDGYAADYSAMQWMVENWNVQIFRAAMGTEAQYGYLTSDANKEKMKNKVMQIVDNAISLGIYVIIDWHSHYASDQQAEAVAFFTEMAQTYGAYPNVLYEIWNEPLNVDWDTVVKPYHEVVTGAIRAADPDNIIILGTPQWCQRPDVAVDSPVEGTNLMYTVHFYSCDHGNKIALNAWAAYLNDIPMFVTEWGATTADGGVGNNSPLCTDEADEWFDEYLDDMNTSFIAWKLDGCSDSSCILQSGAPVTGGWDNYLHGHGPYVVSKLLEN